ncbi:MAG: hypothetical protein Q4E47_03890 [Candidatus Saccharibacteria bacterium]|nr:hypothetical protein [Candidatus Saccharibacteria bacterium]
MKTNIITTKTWEPMRKTARRILPAVAIVAGVAATLLGGQNTYAETQQTWGPERPTFTWESPADYRTINSITNNPEVGDERNFVRVREADTEDSFSDNVTAKPGKYYEVYVYFHNNAKTSLNASGKGMANNVRLSMGFPEVIQNGQAGEIKGTICASNTDPGCVWDTAYIHAPAGQTVYLRYVPNSAVIYSLGTINGKTLSDSALYSTDGAKLGYYEDYWGVLPGCSEYAGYVKFKIKIDQPGFYMEKTASTDGGNTWGQYITVKPGDTIDFKIRYHNTGTTLQKNVTAFDNMPEGLSTIPGSTFLKTPTTQGFEKEGLFNGGLDIGDYTADQEAYITYQVLVGDESQFNCGETIVYNNSAVATKNGTIHDKVQIKVYKQCSEEPEMPEELPTTGPGQIVLGVVVVTAMGTGVAYYVASRKQLASLEDQAEGKK